MYEPLRARRRGGGAADDDDMVGWGQATETPPAQKKEEEAHTAVSAVQNLGSGMDMLRTGDPTESMPVLDDPQCQGPVFTGRHIS